MNEGRPGRRDATDAPTDAACRLSRFLLEPNAGAVPPLDLLRRTRLAAWACTQLESGEPTRSALLPDLLTSTTAHQTAVTALTPLIAAWRDADIPVLAFKGFALALDTYPQPGQRFYEDVDVLLDPKLAGRAERIATRLGWRVRWSADRSANAYSHELMHLVSPDESLHLDVHRRILHSYAPWQGTQRRITDAAWKASRDVPLDGTVVRTLDPRDAMLIGVVLNRAWSSDGWRLKPRDYLDLHAIVQRHDVAKSALYDRARELRCRTTLDLFLARCDPYERRLDLSPPTWRQRVSWTLQIAHERRPHQLDHAANLGLLAPAVARDVVRELPGVLRVLRLLRREPDVERLLRRLDDGPSVEGPCRASERRRYRLVRGVRFALRLLRVRREGDCLPRSLAVFAALRRLACPAVFVSGVRRSEAGLHGHAWVELDGEVLSELNEPLGVTYHPNVRHPAADPTSPSSSSAATPPPPA